MRKTMNAKEFELGFGWEENKSLLCTFTGVHFDDGFLFGNVVVLDEQTGNTGTFYIKHSVLHSVWNETLEQINRSPYSECFDTEEETFIRDLVKKVYNKRNAK